MKKLFIIFILFVNVLPTMALQLQESQIQRIQSSGQRTKIYSSTGSLMGYREVKNNGTIATYNRYHQKTGYYKQDGSRVKYYTK